MRREPLLLHVERRRSSSGCAGSTASPDTGWHIRHHEGAAGVDALHQVVALHVGLGDRRARTALALLTTMSMPPNFAAVLSMAAFTASSSRTSTTRGRAWPPAFSICSRRRVDRAFELGMRRLGLGRDGDIGAVARGPQRDRKPDAARGAGDEQCLALERHRLPHNVRVNACASGRRRRLLALPPIADAA